MQEHYKVYVLFDKNVPESHKYKVEPKSEDFTDKGDIEIERDRLYEQGFNKWHSLKIMMLWRIKKTK